MARAQALRLGPFVGGLNTTSDPTAVADSELVECINFELDIDGSLQSRPPIVETTNNDAVWTNRIVIIGRATIAGVSYIIGSNSNGTYAFNGTSWSTIQANLHSHVALQYRDNVYIIPKPGTKATQNGGRWDGTTFTADANMPEGEAAVFHKSRLFVTPGASATTDASRLSYTDTITSVALTWGSFTDISVGDGENLVDVIVYNDNLLLFKQDSTYVLAYDLQPTDAIVREISTNIGATAYNCVAQYENSVFIYHEGNVYEVVNYDFARVSIKVPFVYDGNVPTGTTRVNDVFLSLVGDRLVVRYYNRIYVYGLKTRTWTRWESANSDLHNFGPLVPFPSNPTQSVNVKYYAGSCLSQHEKVFYTPDGYDATTKEKTLTTEYDIVCSMRTKNFDMADSHHFKKLMWWGADLYTNQNIVGKATPIVSSFRARWSDVAALTWGSVATRTWGQPLSEPYTQATSITDNSAVMRKFVKFLKTLRFRQIYFFVELRTDGTTVEGPCRVFTLTAIIASKQTVGKQVN